MKKALLSLLILLGFAGKVGAQTPSACMATLTKTGTGLTRTYTVSSVATGTVNYYIGTWNNGSSSTSTFTINYTSPGYYYVRGVANTATCTDTAILTDTVYGDIVCPTNFTLSQQQYGNSPQFNFFMNNAPAVPPGYTKITVFDYGDGTTGAANTHNYIRPQSNIKVKVTLTYTHPTFATCVLQDSLYLNVTTCPGITNNGIYHYTYAQQDYFGILQNGTPGTGYNHITRWYLLVNGTGMPQEMGVGTGIYYTFPTNGNHTVIATTSFAKNNVSNSLCIKTDTLLVNVINAFSNVRVVVQMDSILVLPMVSPVLRTWLIRRDSTAGTLTAIDSVSKALDTSDYSHVYLDFHNLPAGNYRFKSHIINQAAGLAVHFIPTYGDSAAYWNLADSLIISTDTNLYKYIYLKKGSPTTGPGFIGGLISASANKGTSEGDPVAGINVLLRDISGKLISMATTGADGRYAFTNVALGVYTVYPEELNFSTIPSDPIVIAAVPAGFTPHYNFKRNAADREYVPGISLGMETVTELKVSVTPNPATDKLQINLGSTAGKVTATLSNTTGQVVLQEVISGSNTTLSVSQLPAGMYLLQLQNGKEIHTEKVQIQR